MTYLTEDIQKILLKSLGTVKKSSELAFLLDDLRASTFVKGADTKVLVEKVSHFSQDLKNLISGLSGDSLRDVSDEVRGFLKSTDIIKVEMSYLPSADFSAGLYEIFLSLGYNNFLFDFSISEDVGTGARFYYKGNFLNVSMFDLIKEKLDSLNLEI